MRTHFTYMHVKVFSFNSKMLLSISGRFSKQFGVTEHINANSCVTIHCCLDQYPWPAMLSSEVDSNNLFYTLSPIAKCL